MQKGPVLCGAHRALPAVTTALVAADVALPTAADDPAHAHVLLFLHKSKLGHLNTSVQRRKLKLKSNFESTS